MMGRLAMLTDTLGSRVQIVGATDLFVTNTERFSGG